MIYFNNRRNAVDCLIRDISPYGARLIFSDAVTTPDVLDLYIPQKEQTLRVHVIWRHGQEVGVAFAQAAQMEPAAETGEPGESRRARRPARDGNRRPQAHPEEDEDRHRARVRRRLTAAGDRQKYACSLFVLDDTVRPVQNSAPQ